MTKQLLLLITAIVMSTLSAFAGSSTYYSQVTVKGETGKGLVYVSKTASTPSASDFQLTKSLNLEEKNEKTTVYLFAQPEEGYGLSHWVDKNNAVVKSPVTVTGNKSSSSRTVYEYTAVFFKIEDHYIKVTAAVDANCLGGGTVSISESENAPTNPDELGNTVEKSIKGLRKDVTFYLHAIPVRGYEFKHWIDASGNTFTESQVNVEGSPDENTPATFSYTAVFEPVALETAVVVNVNDSKLGTATIDQATNAVGDNVTVTAAKIRVRNSEMGAHYSKNHVFEGWYDEMGNLLSTSLKYTFTIEKPCSLTARFSLGQSITGPGYYRFRWFGHDVPGKEEFMTLLGAYNPVSGTSLSQRKLDGVMQFTTSYSHPGSVMRVEGSFSSVDNRTGELTVATNLVLHAQGQSTKTVLDDKNISLTTAHNPGYYKIACSASLGTLVLGAYSHGTSMSENGATMFITRNKPTDDINDPNSYFDVEPLDEEHIDQFYFGAEPSESDYYDDPDYGEGYWTTMFTSFPYRCYDAGLEAFIVTGFSGGPIGYRVKIEPVKDGKVPANTAVILRCPGTTAKENRLLPLMEEVAPLTNNLLKGEFQLNKSASDTGHVKFESHMQTLTVSRNYIIFAPPAQAQTRATVGDALPGNRAYLNLNELVANGHLQPGIDPADIYLELFNPVSGIENVAVDAEDPDAPMYDLYGRRITNPAPGTIYIRNGKKYVMGR